MTRACVLLSILLANSRAWPHRPPFIAASRASCLIRNKEFELKLTNEIKTSCKDCYNDIHKNIFFHLLPAKQQQLPEALRLFADVLGDGHECVRQEGQWSGSRLFLGSCQWFIVKINQVGLIGTFSR